MTADSGDSGGGDTIRTDLGFYDLRTATFVEYLVHAGTGPFHGVGNNSPTD
jgi:hypothetical protein